MDSEEISIVGIQHTQRLKKGTNSKHEIERNTTEHDKFQKKST